MANRSTALFEIENHTHIATAWKISKESLFPLFFVIRRSNYDLNIFLRSCCPVRVIKCYGWKQSEAT